MYTLYAVKHNGMTGYYDVTTVVVVITSPADRYTIVLYHMTTEGHDVTTLRVT